MKFTKKEEVQALFNQLVPNAKVRNFQFESGIGMADVAVAENHEMTAVYLPTQGQYDTWAKNYLAGLQKYYPSTTESESESNTWDTEYTLDEENKAALAKMTIGSGVILLVADSKESMEHPEVTACVESSRSASRKSDLSDIIATKAKENKLGMAGPIITGVMLLAMSFLHFAVGEEAILSFRSIDIPGFVSGPIIALMAIFAFRHKIKLTFFFMLIRLVWSVIIIALEVRLGFEEEIAMLLMILEIGVIISALAFHKHFGFKSAGELFKDSITK